MKFGNTKIGGMSFGSTKIGGAKYGNTLVFQPGGSPVPTPVLPEGYALLEYIENPLGNSAYIDTGITPGNDIGFKLDFMSYDELSSTSGYGCIMGCRYASNTNDFQITSYTGTGNSGTLRLGGAGNNYNANLPAKNTRFVASLSNGTRYKCGASEINTTANLTAYYSISVFALRIMYSPSNQNGHGRLYELILYSGTTKVAHYIPCTNPSSEVGVYDLVNEVFKKSGNSTPFIAGPIIL